MRKRKSTFLEAAFAKFKTLTCQFRYLAIVIPTSRNLEDLLYLFTSHNNVGEHLSIFLIVVQDRIFSAGSSHPI